MDEMIDTIKHNLYGNANAYTDVDDDDVAFGKMMDDK